jgi:NAD(P)-dependent dehydrogenase (short-subunit alcohol dehydrogenase family)
VSAGTALSNEVALITGGASGLGLAVARRFVTEGARVAVFDRSAERLADVDREFGGAVVTIRGDVRELADNEAAVRRCVEALGGLSIFVGNAGIYDHRVSLADMPAETIDRAFDELYGINVKGYILGSKAALPELVRARGSIVFTCSVSGLFAGYGGFLYVTAKHAVAALARHLAVELAPDVRVNAVAPGYVPTNLSGLETLAQGASKSGGARDPQAFLLERIPTAEDYTGLYVMLASRESAATMTGAVILADGGGSIHRVVPPGST